MGSSSTPADHTNPGERAIDKGREGEGLKEPALPSTTWYHHHPRPPALEHRGECRSVTGPFGNIKLKVKAGVPASL